MTVEEIGAGAPCGPVNPTSGALGTLTPLGYGDVVLTGGWLGAWQDRILAVTLPQVLDRVEGGEAVANLLRLTRRTQGPHQGMVFTDSDVYKTLEAVAWAMPAARPAGTGLDDGGTGPVEGSGAAALLRRAEEMVALLGQVQEADGYLNSWVQGTPGLERWSDPRMGHELYCAGHLFQAAVAAHVTGVLPELGRVAARFADLLVETFADSDYVDGHPEVETALVELYRVTGRAEYLDLARRQVDRRGHDWLGAGQRASYFQDGVPVRAATAAVGHAVRQLYLLAGVVDVAVETADAELLEAAVRLWDDLAAGKTYVTGAHGSRHRDEALGDAYELPPDRAYAETCAAIGAYQLAWRLLLATGEGRFADAMETLLYNAIAGAVSAEGDRYFYSNPLQLRTGHDGSDEDAPSGRLAWYACACCPPNVARLLSSVRSYLLTRTEDGVQIHHPATARVDVTVAGLPISLDLSTDYPYDGALLVTVETAGDMPWELALRVPSWCGRVTVTVDGGALDVGPSDGYVRLRRSWSGRHTVRLGLDMPVRTLAAHPRVDAVRGCVALARGPLLYALEQADLPRGVILEDVRLLAVRGVVTDGVVASGVEPGPRVRVEVTAVVRPSGPDLYAPVHLRDDPDAVTPTEPFRATLLPYHLWANRSPGAMRVWLPLAPLPLRSTPRPP